MKAQGQGTWHEGRGKVPFLPFFSTGHMCLRPANHRNGVSTLRTPLRSGWER